MSLGPPLTAPPKLYVPLSCLLLLLPALTTHHAILQVEAASAFLQRPRPRLLAEHAPHAAEKLDDFMQSLLKHLGRVDTQLLYHLWQLFGGEVRFEKRDAARKAAEEQRKRREERAHRRQDRADKLAAITQARAHKQSRRAERLHRRNRVDSARAALQQGHEAVREEREKAKAARITEVEAMKARFAAYEAALAKKSAGGEGEGENGADSGGSGERKGTEEDDAAVGARGSAPPEAKQGEPLVKPKARKRKPGDNNDGDAKGDDDDNGGAAAPGDDDDDETKDSKAGDADTGGADAGADAPGADKTSPGDADDAKADSGEAGEGGDGSAGAHIPSSNGAEEADTGTDTAAPSSPPRAPSALDDNHSQDSKAVDTPAASGGEQAKNKTSTNGADSAVKKPGGDEGGDGDGDTKTASEASGDIPRPPTPPSLDDVLAQFEAQTREEEGRFAAQLAELDAVSDDTESDGVDSSVSEVSADSAQSVELVEDDPGRRMPNTEVQVHGIVSCDSCSIHDGALNMVVFVPLCLDAATTGGAS